MAKSVLNINLAGINISLLAKKSINEARKKRICAGIFTKCRPDVIMEEEYCLSGNIRPRRGSLSLDKKQWSFYDEDNRKIFRLKASPLNPEVTALFDRDMVNGRIFVGKPDYDWTERTAFAMIVMATALSLKQRFTLHASGVTDGQGGYLFLGGSGAGKTTMSNLWHRKGATVIHDDQITVYKKNSHFMMVSGNIFETRKFGNSADLTEAALDNIFFLRHGKKNMLCKTNRLEAFRRMIKERFFPVWDKNAMRNMLSFWLDLVKTVPTDNLAFIPHSCCVDFIKMKKEVISDESKKAA